MQNEDISICSLELENRLHHHDVNNLMFWQYFVTKFVWQFTVKIITTLTETLITPYKGFTFSGFLANISTNEFKKKSVNPSGFASSWIQVKTLKVNPVIKWRELIIICLDKTCLHPHLPKHGRHCLHLITLVFFSIIYV